MNTMNPACPKCGAPIPPEAPYGLCPKCVLERALAALEREFGAAGKALQFERLKPWLVGETAALSQAEVARALGLNEGAVKVAIHRLRKRFRKLLRAEVSQTLAEGDDVEGELRYLVEACGQR